MDKLLVSIPVCSYCASLVADLFLVLLWERLNAVSSGQESSIY